MNRGVLIGIGTVSSVIGGYVVYNKCFDKIAETQTVQSGNNPISSRSPIGNDMHLKLVQVVFRHGARTPLTTPEYFSHVHYHEKLLKHGDHTHVPIETKNIAGENIDIASSMYNKHPTMYGDKSFGELTAKGADQMYQLGCKLREKYITSLSFLPSNYSEAVYVRSTSVKRAVESARATLSGMFPDQNTPIPISIASMDTEILYPNFRNCEYLKSLTRWCWSSPHLIEGMQKEMEDIQMTLGIPLDKKPHPVILRDYLYAHDHHDLLPEQYKVPEALQKAEAAAIKLMDHAFSGHRETREIALRLGIGPLIMLFVNNMQSAIDRTSDVKMRLFSGHDTTLMPLLRAVGYEEHKWPSYGASIILELYEGKNESEKVDHFVRVLYQHEEMKIAGCDEVFCQIDKFRQALSKFFIGDEEYRERCAVKDDDFLKLVPKEEKVSEKDA